jgi:SAM-dependent methyltransferase
MGSADVQAQFWNRAAHDWAELQEPLARPLWEAMLAAGSVGPGTHLLDAGCGAGGASVLAAGRGALVNGLDAAAALLAIARARVPDADFRLGDLEALPYADGTFDAIIGADVLPYVADPPAALRELRRVCRPGGRVVLAIGGAEDPCAQRAIAAGVRALLPRPLDEDPFVLSGPGVLEALVTRAGLRTLGAGGVACVCAYPDRETAWSAQASAGPLQAALRLVGTAPLKAAVLRALEPYATRTGDIRLTQHFRYVTATPADDGPSRRRAVDRGKGAALCRE